MTGLVVTRPIWRRFSSRFLDRALAHVRAGGLAAVVHPGEVVEVWIGSTETGALTEWGAWALASLEHEGASTVAEGVGAGLHAARLDSERGLSVLDWCERDAAHPGPTRAMQLDCVACTACCQDADVHVEPADLERLRASGYASFASEEHYERDAAGRLHLRFSGPRCDHLEAAGTCAIYVARFKACRAFPPGSEPCLAAREDTLDVRDDVPDPEPKESPV